MNHFFRSSWIITEIIRDKRKLGLVYHRLLLVMSIGDVVLSIGFFLSTWPIPIGTPDIYGAAGTTATCTAQGFFQQVAIVSQIYNAYLAIYFVLTIRYSWTEARLQKLEPYVHGFYLAFAFGTASAGLALNLFNSANLWCWIAPYPTGCTATNTCERGANAWIYRMAFWYVWLWLSLLTVTVAMCLVFWTVHQSTKQMSQYAGGGTSASKNRNNVAWQAFWYICSFYVTSLFNTILRLMQRIQQPVPFVLLLLMVIFHPMQGGWNLLIYMRPRYLRYREQNPDWTISRALIASSSNWNFVDRLRNELHTDTGCKRSAASDKSKQTEPSSARSSAMTSSNAVPKSQDEEASLELQIAIPA